MASDPITGRADARKAQDLAETLGLTKRQRAFAENLVADPEGNQSLAAKKAGYKDAAPAGSRMVRDSKVKQYIEFLQGAAERNAVQRSQRTILRKGEILALLTEHAKASPAAFLDPEDPTIKRIRETGKEHLIKGLKIERQTINTEAGPVTKEKVEVQVVDQQGALDKLAKWKKLYSDEGQGGTTVHVDKMLVLLPAEQRAKAEEAIQSLNVALLGIEEGK